MAGHHNACHYPDIIHSRWFSTHYLAKVLLIGRMDIESFIET